MRLLMLLLSSGLFALGCGGSPTMTFGDATGGGSGGDGGASGGSGGAGESVGASVGGSSSSGAGGASVSVGAGGAGGGQGGDGGASSSETSSSTATGEPINLSGCSDGTREYFITEANAHHGIAGCAGGFQVAGTKTAASTVPKCDRAAGNDSDNAAGAGCSIEDLCAEGWHVCAGAAEVAAKAGGCELLANGAPKQFWLTRQGQGRVGTSVACTDDGVDNVVGCGNLGETPGQSCDPLNRYLRDYTCRAQGSAWSCDKNKYAADDDEAYSITKPKPEQGGVLCCED